MQKKISLRVFIILFVFVLWQCASQGYPEGGPKDETPPKMVNSEPPMDAMNFDGNEIVIEFNELVVLEDAIEKIVVSPPLNEQPAFTGAGNEVTVKFNEELQPATTYTIDFADAIRDNNEGNPLEDFTFTFSTGETKDSLRISGHLLEAESHEPVEGALVMAHSNHADSAFTKMVPPRVSKTNENGRFSIKNLAEGDYRVFALEDANRNYRFDLWDERIAWHPERVEPHYEWRERTDSVFKDSVTLDTVMVYDELVYLPDSLQLFLFQEEDERQSLDEDNRSEPHRMDFVFNRPLHQKLGVKLLDPEPEKEDWFIYERSAKHDSVMIWLNDSSLIDRDSLMIQATYQVRDSLDELVEQRDTLNMVSRSTDRNKSEEEDAEKPPFTPLPVKMTSGTQDIRGSARLNFPVPVDRINREGIEVAQLVDTVYQPVEFELEQDTVQIRQYKIVHEREPGEEYRVSIDSAAIRDIYGRPNNEESSKFSIKEEDNYGTLYINLEAFKDNALLQVLDTEDEVVRKGKVPDSGKLAFRFVKPGSYFLRVLYDKNDNGEWDPGDFSEDIQPERVHYYPDTIDVRENWDQVVPWDMEEHPLFEFVEKNRLKKEEEKNSSQSRNQRR
ncbi:MAG: Ig-like domain-containing domain [Marinilabiliaceae bacterium]